MMVVLIFYISSSFAENCPQYNQVYNGEWIENFDGWVKTSNYNQKLTAEGFNGVTVVNNKTVICEYQNSAERKNYINTDIIFKNIQGNDWAASQNNTILKCTSQDPVACPFVTFE